MYRLTDEAATVLRTFGTPDFDATVAKFIAKFGSLREDYRRIREICQIPLRLCDGTTLSLSPGVHNSLQVGVIQEFGPRFAPGAVVLYLGDTARKHIIFDVDEFSRLHIPITEHDKLPDIILYWAERNWLYLIEAVTSHGPVSPKRHRELEGLLKESPVDRIYVTAFLGAADFRKYAGDIAWETEVWIAESPDHLIHFNGPKFLGPYRERNVD